MNKHPNSFTARTAVHTISSKFSQAFASLCRNNAVISSFPKFRDWGVRVGLSPDLLMGEGPTVWSHDIPPNQSMNWVSRAKSCGEVYTNESSHKHAPGGSPASGVSNFLLLSNTSMGKLTFPRIFEVFSHHQPRSMLSHLRNVSQSRFRNWHCVIKRGVYLSSPPLSIHPPSLTCSLF